MASQIDFLKKQQRSLLSSRRQSYSLQAQQESLKTGRTAMEIISAQESEKSQQEIAIALQGQDTPELSLYDRTNIIEKQFKYLSEKEAREIAEDPEVFNTALAYIERKASGKGGAGNVSLMKGYGTPEYNKYVSIILRDPRIKEAYYAGLSARSQARSYGFTDVGEFASAQGWGEFVVAEGAKGAIQADESQKLFMGPVRPGTSEEAFRKTGSSQELSPMDLVPEGEIPGSRSTDTREDRINRARETYLEKVNTATTRQDEAKAEIEYAKEVKGIIQEKPGEQRASQEFDFFSASGRKSGGFGLVSGMATDSKDLKGNGGSEVQNVTGISDRLFSWGSSGNDRGVADSSQRGGFLGNIIGDITSGLKKGHEEKKDEQISGESYIPELGAYGKTSRGVPVVSASTLEFRQPDPGEKRQIEHTELISSFAPLPKGTTPEGFSEQIIRGGIDLGLSVMDFATTGGTTSKQLNKKQEDLNKEVEKFNERYGGKELNAKEYKEAQLKEVELEERQKIIEEEMMGKITSPSYKVSSAIFGNFGRGSLNPIIDEDTQEPIRVYADTMDIMPAASFLGKVKELKFVGAQKVSKSGDIVTDVLFMADDRIGTASSIARTNEDDLFDLIVKGKSGKYGVEFPSGKGVIKDTKSFVGQGLSKQSEINLKKSVILDTDASLMKITSIEGVDLIKTEGLVETASARGDKIIRRGVEFPTGKIVEKPAVRIKKDLTAFKSLAEQNNDIAKITGYAASKKGSRSEFSGFIKLLGSEADDAGNVMSFMGGGKKSIPSQQLQNKAVSDTIASIAGSMSKQNALGKAKPVISAGTAAPRVSQSLKKLADVGEMNVIQKDVQKENIALASLESSRVSSSAVSSLSNSMFASPQRTVQSLNEQMRSLNAQLVSPGQATQMRTVTTLKMNMTGVQITPFAEINVPRQIIPSFNFPGREKYSAAQRAEQAYDVFIKGRKVSDVPMSREEALDFGSWVSDNTLAAQFHIKKSSKKPGQTKYNIPHLNWTFAKEKFRDYEVRKGKQIPLKDKFIEKAPNRLDTEGEVRRIQVARFLAQERKKTSRKEETNKNLQKAIFGNLMGF